MFPCRFSSRTQGCWGNSWYGGKRRKARLVGEAVRGAVSCHAELCAPPPRAGTASGTRLSGAHLPRLAVHPTGTFSRLRACAGGDRPPHRARVKRSSCPRIAQHGLAGRGLGLHTLERSRDYRPGLTEDVFNWGSMDCLFFSNKKAQGFYVRKSVFLCVLNPTFEQEEDTQDLGRGALEMLFMKIRALWLV